MDKAALRKLNNQLINATARLERALLAKRLAEVEAGHLRTLRDDALNKVYEDLSSPKYSVHIVTGGPQKIQVIKAVRSLQMDAHLPYGLKEAKDHVDAAMNGSLEQATFLRGVTFEFAQNALKTIAAAGGVAAATGENQS